MNNHEITNRYFSIDDDIKELLEKKRQLEESLLKLEQEKQLLLPKIRTFFGSDGEPTADLEDIARKRRRSNLTNKEIYEIVEIAIGLVRAGAKSISAKTTKKFNSNRPEHEHVSENSVYKYTIEAIRRERTKIHDAQRLGNR
jgi:hypothetical protein